MSSTVFPSRDDIIRSLDHVYDPELDESITKLGFLDDVLIDGHHVTVSYKLPTYWCAPNFAYMMSSDVRTEVARVPGVESVRVVLHDHCAGTEINEGVNADQSFRAIFPDEVVDELEELRRKFLHKSFLARQEQLIRRMRQVGLSDSQIVALRMGDVVPDGENVVVRGEGLRVRGEGLGAGGICVRLGASDLEKYLRKRVGLGLPNNADALLFTTLEGMPLELATLADYLRRSRTIRVSIAFNSSMCEGLLRTRYHDQGSEHNPSVGDQLIALM